MAASKSRQVLLEELPVGLVDQVAGELAEKGGLAFTKLTKVKLARTAHAELQEKLIRRGFERTAKALRVPAEKQIRAVLAESAAVPLAGLSKKLAALTQTEAKSAAFALARSGIIRLVIVRGKEHLALPSAAQIDPGEIRELTTKVGAMTALLKKVAPKAREPARTLPRGEFEPLLREMATSLGLSLVSAEQQHRPLVDVSLASGSAGAGEGRVGAVLGALAALGEADPLVYVPELVRSLRDALTPEQVLEVLGRASVDGLVELRPESGIGTLSREDTALCLPGPEGTLLSYVRSVRIRGDSA